MAKKSSGSGKEAGKTPEKPKGSKKASSGKKGTRKIVRKPLKVADLEKIREAIGNGIEMVWNNENTLALRIDEVGRLVERALEQLDVLGNGVVRLYKKVESLEKAAGAGKKPKPSPAGDAKKAEEGDLDSVRKAVEEDLNAVRQALEKDLGALHEQIGPMRLALEKGSGGGVTYDFLQDLLAEQFGVMNDRLKALESGRPAEGLSEKDVRTLIEEAEPGIVESKLFAKFLGSAGLKDLVDEKFNTLRDWLSREEIPRQIEKISGRRLS